nr:hypothetical protein [Acetobacter ghanensis]
MTTLQTPNPLIRTEMQDPRYDGLDTWPTNTVLEALLESQLAATASVKAALPDMEAAIAQAVPRLERGGRLFYVGAGHIGPHRVAGRRGADSHLRVAVRAAGAAAGRRRGRPVQPRGRCGG